MWQSMKTASKNKEILIYDEFYLLGTSKLFREIRNCFWGYTLNENNVWVDIDSFDDSWNGYMNCARNPICWQELPKFPIQEEIDNFKKENQNVQ